MVEMKKVGSVKGRIEHYLFSIAISLLLLLIGSLQQDAIAQDAPAPPPAAAPAAAPENAAAAPATAGSIVVEDAASAPSEDTPPAPKYGPNGELLISVNFISTPIERVVADISKKSQASVIGRGKTAGQRVSVNARNESVERVLDKLVNSQANWLWQKTKGRSNSYEIWDTESYKVEVLPKEVRQKVFQPRDIPAEEVNKAIAGMLTEGIGTSSFDPRSNKVIVTDLPTVLEIIQRLIDQIDVKLYTRVFSIEHADVNTIAEKLTNLKSAAAPNPEVDERTRQIIVRDRLEIVSQMASLVETLDIGPEMRVYDLNNIGVESEHNEAIQEAVEELITEGAYLKINEASARMIVQDVPSVHEKIEAVLAAFDQPQKQVNVEMEVVETYLQEGFEYSIDYNFSQDMFASVLDGLITVPQGKSTDSNSILGYRNLSQEFPYASGGSTGLDVNHLSSHWFIKLHALQQDGKARILQQPRVLIKNKNTVTFRVGNRLPYMTGGYGSGYTNSSGQWVNSSGGNVQFIDDGLELEVTPTITNNGMIEIDVTVNNRKATLTTIKYQGDENTAPETKTQELGTTLMVPSGETRVIGGLITETEAEARGGIPYLYKIPKIGPLLFGSVKKPLSDNMRKNLLIFITPTVVVDKPGDLMRYKGRVLSGENEDISAELAPYADSLNGYTETDVVPMQVPMQFDSSQQDDTGMTSTDVPTSNEKEWSPDENSLKSIDSSESIDDFQSGASSFESLPRVNVADGSTSGALSAYQSAIKGPSGSLTSTDTSTQQQNASPTTNRNWAPPEMMTPPLNLGNAGPQIQIQQSSDRSRNNSGNSPSFRITSAPPSSESRR
ncbi:MAG: secretin N-terminal domain-containing protein [Candidatus Sumerlaeales bacterium]|nr:secretin N-terminal domain-containing protein [Candidatus Sumerlaeales bacterium]